jgi:AraC-like DNA-binding protein
MEPVGNPVLSHDPDRPETATGSFTIGAIDRIGPPGPTFYEFVHITGVGTDERDLQPPQVCVTVPGQNAAWRPASRLEGHVVLFTDDFLLTHPGDRDALHRLGQAPRRRLTAEESGRVQHLIVTMDRERRQREPGFRGVLQAYLHVLIVETGRLHRQWPVERGNEPAVALVERFRELLDDPDFLGSSVPAYAARLGVSTGHLSDVVNQALDAAPGHLIRQARAAEAKRLLAGTALSVTQVSGRLGFADTAYFCRFFRREVGETPGSFRRRAGGTA